MDSEKKDTNSPHGRIDDFLSQFKPYKNGPSPSEAGSKPDSEDNRPSEDTSDSSVSSADSVSGQEPKFNAEIENTNSITNPDMFNYTSAVCGTSTYKSEKSEQENEKTAFQQNSESENSKAEKHSVNISHYTDDSNVSPVKELHTEKLSKPKIAMYSVFALLSIAVILMCCTILYLEISNQYEKLIISDLPSDADNSYVSYPQTTVGQDNSGALKELSVEEICEKVTPSIVGVTCESYTNVIGASSSSGSGIIMSADGYIVTNYHVIQGSDKINVVLSSGDSYSASIVGSDERTDIAVLKVSASELPLAEFGDSDKIKQGALAVAIGNPLGLDGTATQGCISAINRDIVVDSRIMTLIQTDASINPGNSGGALVNKYGQVIGINSVKLGLSYYEGLGFAIPINTVKPIVEELIAYGYVKGRPAIGIMGRSISKAASAYYGVPSGVLVDSVVPSTDAYEKGITVGDIITAVNGEAVSNMNEISIIRDKFVAGDELTFTIYRDNQYIDITFKLMDAVNVSY